MELEMDERHGNADEDLRRQGIRVVAAIVRHLT